VCAVGEVYADNDLKNSDLALHEESLAKRRDVDARKSYEELAFPKHVAIGLGSGGNWCDGWLVG
jgi:hypothetical protein